MDKYFKKELLPGYTGHIPAKKDVFGITSGEVNRQLVLGHPGIEKAVEGRQFYTEGKVVRGEGKDLDRLKFGLHSRDGVNWIAGPTNEIFPQHVPGTIYIYNIYIYIYIIYRVSGSCPWHRKRKPLRKILC